MAADTNLKNAEYFVKSATGLVFRRKLAKLVYTCGISTGGGLDWRIGGSWAQGQHELYGEGLFKKKDGDTVQWESACLQPVPSLDLTASLLLWNQMIKTKTIKKNKKHKTIKLKKQDVSENMS